MAALNYYIGFRRGALSANPFLATTGTASAGTAVDLEVRIQMDNGSGPTGMTCKDVNILLDAIEGFVNSDGLNHAGANIPPL